MGNIFKNLQCVEVRMRILSKMEVYNGETKVKHQILRLLPAEINQENRNHLNQMEAFIKKMR